MHDTYDLVVIGAGQSGPFLAAKWASRGHKVALIEQRELGGTCVNRGCTPTKTLLKSARIAYLARRARDFGIDVGPVKVDFKAAMDRMQTRVDQSREGLESWLGGIDKLTIVRGHGQLAGCTAGQFAVHCGERRLQTPRVMLNTGTRPFVPPIEGLNDVPYLDNESLLALRELPHHLIIVGGSYIGLEMGQIFRRLGSEVTIIETGDRVTGREDPDICAAITSMLEQEGISIRTGTGVQQVRRRDGQTPGVGVRLDDGSTVSGSHLMVATGRVPNTDRLGLATIGLANDERGYLATNGRLETAVPGVWALGDINGRGAFTHTSYHDHEIVDANETGGDRSADERPATYAMFTDPPLAHVGLYEADARGLVQSGRSISQGVMPMAEVARAKEEGETTGMIKVLVDEDSGLLLGASVLGIQADEVIQVIGQVMAANGTWQGMREALPVHPTVSELLPTVLGKREPLSAP